MNQAYYNKKIRVLQKRVHELEALLNQDPAPAPETQAPKKDKAKNGKKE